MEDVVQYITLCEGTVYGGYVRDTLCGDTPERIDAHFQFRVDYEMFLNMCPIDFELRLDEAVHMVFTSSGVHVECLIGRGFPDFQYECDTLAITHGGMACLVYPLSITELMRVMTDARNRVARELRVSPRGRVHMWNRGWRIVGPDMAASKIQAQFRKAMAVPYYTMCKRRLLREGAELEGLT